MTTEIKAFRFTDMQVKADGTAGTLEGYGSSFGGDPDSYGDIVAKGAFAASLRQRMPKMLYQHDSGAIAGVWDSAEEDNHGLSSKVASSTRRSPNRRAKNAQPARSTACRSAFPPTTRITTQRLVSAP